MQQINNGQNGNDVMQFSREWTILLRN